MDSKNEGVLQSNATRKLIESFHQALAEKRWRSLRLAAKDLGFEYTSFSRMMTEKRNLSVRVAADLSRALQLGESFTIELVSDLIAMRLGQVTQQELVKGSFGTHSLQVILQKALSKHISSAASGASSNENDVSPLSTRTEERTLSSL